MLEALWWIPLALVVLLLGGVGFLKLLDNAARKNPQELSALPPLTVHTGKKQLRLGVARSADAVGQGLAGQKELKQLQGIVLVAPGKGTRVSTLGMNFALDLYWLNSDFQVVHRVLNAAPGIWPISYHSKAPAAYVIQLPAKTLNPQQAQVGNTLNLGL